MCSSLVYQHGTGWDELVYDQLIVLPYRVCVQSISTDIMSQMYVIWSCLSIPSLKELVCMVKWTILCAQPHAGLVYAVWIPLCSCTEYCLCNEFTILSCTCPVWILWSWLAYNRLWVSNFPLGRYKCVMSIVLSRWDETDMFLMSDNLTWLFITFFLLALSA